MSQISRKILLVGSFIAALCASAHASPSCLREKQPFALADDIVSWTMTTTSPECIQGLRWSYMQIYGVLVLKPPKKGKLVIVGSGFRYFADPASHDPDEFTLVVVGKNRHETGKSIVDITINPTSLAATAAAPDQL
ncbi:hypothetical protein [uncultured Bradyrhizobium sp.]|jgi:hypothetical protein|uniref:hypothetical protein n=1 Tax=uncultured Bradyrhizobium sp. TaxID=199684 RepID=UPI002628EA9B|nr:hypothetical protein [uncultured Bradyrhizobium sp.]